MRDVEVVMPVYNESECIGEVVDDWIRVLDEMGLAYCIRVLNDGSKDNTAEVLAAYDTHDGIAVVNKANSGHGPTILMGYRQAVENAEWVFQVDSDNELRAEHFGLVWEPRSSYDAVMGIRDGRAQPLPRKVISMISRLVVRVFYRGGVQDVNCPYRLMRSDVLRPIIEQIPDDTFAPNVVISGVLGLRWSRIYNVPIPHHDRETGEVSIKRWRLLKAAMHSFWQTIALRFRTI
jgi:glycosyltransferase involved in cell wall biosynthesis